MDNAGKSRLNIKEVPKLSTKIKAILSSNKTNNVLDVGCGNGWLRTYLRKESNYIGVSCSKSEIDFINKTGGKGKLHNLEEPLPFKDNSFDCVFASHVLEHFTIREVEALMKEIKRVLKKEGIFIVFTPTDYNPSFWAEWSHVRPYNHGSLPGLLRDFEFRDIDWSYPTIDFLPKAAQTYLRFPLFFLNPLIWNEIYAIGTSNK
jgi:SAM-dependent methyltransferase